jgi:hypothetical protein
MATFYLFIFSLGVCYTTIASLLRLYLLSPRL